MFKQHKNMIDFCVQNLKTHSDEAAWRCGIHAAYYAFYQAALTWAEERGLCLDSNQSVHYQLRQFYLAQNNKNDKWIGKKLKKTFDTRCIADYEWEKSVNKNIFDEHLLHCQQGINEIARLQQSHSTTSSGNTP